jgi:hypothetical protein
MRTLPNLFRLYEKRVDTIHAKEKDSLTKLKIRTPGITPGRPENDWDWLSFGQHYRLKTRLLDWSGKPEIALYFAVENPGNEPIVHVYGGMTSQIVNDNMRMVSPAAIKDRTMIMKPSVHSVRVTLQDAWHTVHHLHEKKTGGQMVIPLGNMKWHKDRLQEIRIDPAKAGEIRQELSRKGIRYSTVYGDFESICKGICTDCFV